MKKLFVPFVFTSLLFFSACNHNANTTADTKAKDATKTEDKTVKIKLADLATNQDLACGMPLEEGAIADTTSYGGKTYGFCSPECKANFIKNPQSFLDKK